MLTTVILPPGVGNPGSVLHSWMRFRRIRWRIPGGPFGSDSSMNLTHFAGKWGLFLGPTREKSKQNQCFWLRTLKNLRKINDFCLRNPRGPKGGFNGCKGSARGAQSAQWGLNGFQGGPERAPREPLQRTSSSKKVRKRPNVETRGLFC